MTKYIEPGMTDRETIESIVDAIVERNAKTRRYDWLEVATGESNTSYTNPVIDDAGNIMTDEPPLGILQDAGINNVVVSYPVKINGTRAEMRRELFDWKDAKIFTPEITSAIIRDGIADTITPPEIAETDEDGDTVDLDALEAEIVDAVEYALDPANNSVRYYDAKPDYNNFWIEGENIDGGSDDLDGIFDLYGAALEYYAEIGQAVRVEFKGRSIYYDAAGKCVNYNSGEEEIINALPPGILCDVLIDFNPIDDDEIEKVRP